MSRYGDDDTPAYDTDEIHANAVCSDCGVAYSRGELDSTPFCDACSDKRDAWATAQELRTIAKAVLATDLTTIKDVA